MKFEKYFKFFACCIPVKGVTRSTICDLQREEIYFIENSILDKLHLLEKTPFEDLPGIQNDPDHEKLLDTLEYLEKEELGFWTREPEKYPPIPKQWDFPGKISNAIIDIGEDSPHNLKNLLCQLEESGCKFIQFRFFSPLEKQELTAICNLTKKFHNIISIELYVKMAKYLSEDFLKAFVKEQPKVKTILVHSAKCDKMVNNPNTKERNSMGNIFYSKKVISSENHCGVIDKVSMVSLMDINAYAEAEMFNSCLNRKVGIDQYGNIKNCPTMDRSFGHVNEDSISKVVEKDEFQKVWNITKDQINDCKVCEFRKVCMDCRAITQNNSEFGKPSGCSYDPINGTWI